MEVTISKVRWQNRKKPIVCLDHYPESPLSQVEYRRMRQDIFTSSPHHLATMHPDLGPIGIISALSLFLPLPWHWRAGNIATLAIIAWLFSVNIIYAVDTIIWGDNVDIVAQVWCDINTYSHGQGITNCSITTISSNQAYRWCKFCSSRSMSLYMHASFIWASDTIKLCGEEKPAVV